MLTCEQVAALEMEMGAGMLEPAEEEAVWEHLQQCRLHPEVAETRAAMLGIGLATETMPPPDHLRDRVLASATEGRSQAFRGRRWAVAAAAALLLVVLATPLVLWVGGNQTLTRQFETEDGIQVTVRANLEQAETNLSFRNMASLSEGEEYQVWAIRDGEWLRMGGFQPGDSGTWSGSFAFQVHEGDSLCVTRGEPTDPYTPHGEPLFIEPL